MGLMNDSCKSFPGSTFEQYTVDFDYHDNRLFHLLFERNKERIKSKKADIAANNLQKIFEATFKLSAKIGFLKREWPIQKKTISGRGF